MNVTEEGISPCVLAIVSTFFKFISIFLECLLSAMLFFRK